MSKNMLLTCLGFLLAVAIIALAVQSDKPNRQLADADYKAMLALDIMSASAVCSVSRMARTDMDTQKDMDACIGQEIMKKAQSV